MSEGGLIRRIGVLKGDFRESMSPGEPDRLVLSPAEIAAAIRALPEAGWLRLRKIAHAYARNCPLEADDLLQTAFTRALASSRQCPRHVDVIRFLAEAMHSIASDSNKAWRRQEDAKASRPELRLVTPAEEDDPLAPVPATPEDIVADEQAAAKIRVTILDLFSDDLVAQTIVEGDMERGMGPVRRSHGSHARHGNPSRRLPCQAARRNRRRAADCQAAHRSIVSSIVL
jgi:DNA-directed RNA polymerase specialized sigma24 family protein